MWQGWEYLAEGTNHVAEYKGLISLMEGAISRGVRCLDAKGDSKLVVEQVKGTYQVREATLMKLHKEVKQLKQKFASFTITHIPRNENEEADRLTHVAREREANGSQKWEPLGQGRWLDLPMRVRASTHAADSEPAPPPSRQREQQ